MKNERTGNSRGPRPRQEGSTTGLCRESPEHLCTKPNYFSGACQPSVEAVGSERLWGLGHAAWTRVTTGLSRVNLAWSK
ncbi:hypothetical protein ACRALDRAFT_2033175 [Sodiomyces alcalophilus JCM 7366]|uniref:uncharacterized protein n=1 Tax=Sodiomyces alcalophilus JCM 7366 TaxID=591952 RepID=UPI0039B3DD49